MRDINHPHTSGFNHIVFMLFIIIMTTRSNTSCKQTGKERKINAAENPYNPYIIM